MKLAIIPARGGSKRIPGKNLKMFGGKPLVCWAIDAARDCRLFDRIIVSTDDAGVARVAAECGAEAPFVRPEDLSDDYASTDAVVLHAVNQIRASSWPFDAGCCIYPSPFVTVSDLQAGYELLVSQKTTSVFPVVEYDFPIEQALLLDGVRPRPRWPELLDVRSQDLPQHVHDAGLFYWFDTEKFLSVGRLLGPDAAAFVVSADRAQDLNTPADWARAEQKLKLLASASIR